MREDDVLFPNDASSGFTCGTRTVREAEASISATVDGADLSIERRYEATAERSTGLAEVDTVVASFESNVVARDGARLDARLDPDDPQTLVETVVASSGERSVERRPFVPPMP